MTRISSRSCSSTARRRTSSRIAERTRRRAAVSRSAVRTASESVSPLERMMSSAAAEDSSSRTCSERAHRETVARMMLQSASRQMTGSAASSSFERSRRELTPRRRRAFLTCVRTVCGESTSSSAISFCCVPFAVEAEDRELAWSQAGDAGLERSGLPDALARAISRERLRRNAWAAFDPLRGRCPAALRPRRAARRRRSGSGARCARRSSTMPIRSLSASEPADLDRVDAERLDEWMPAALDDPLEPAAA